jgi:hypothetical protein
MLSSSCATRSESPAMSESRRPTERLSKLMTSVVSRSSRPSRLCSGRAVGVHDAKAQPFVPGMGQNLLEIVSEGRLSPRDVEHVALPRQQTDHRLDLLGAHGLVAVARVSVGAEELAILARHVAQRRRIERSQQRLEQLRLASFRPHQILRQADGHLPHRRRPLGSSSFSS